MGKGLIPADLDTWKQRRRGVQTLFNIFVIFVPFYVLDSASDPLYNLQIFFSVHEDLGCRRYKN